MINERKSGAPTATATQRHTCLHVQFVSVCSSAVRCFKSPSFTRKTSSFRVLVVEYKLQRTAVHGRVQFALVLNASSVDIQRY